MIGCQKQNNTELPLTSMKKDTKWISLAILYFTSSDFSCLYLDIYCSLRHPRLFRLLQETGKTTIRLEECQNSSILKSSYLGQLILSHGILPLHFQVWGKCVSFFHRWTNCNQDSPWSQQNLLDHLLPGLLESMVFL